MHVMQQHKRRPGDEEEGGEGGRMERPTSKRRKISPNEKQPSLVRILDQSFDSPPLPFAREKDKHSEHRPPSTRIYKGKLEAIVENP